MSHRHGARFDHANSEVTFVSIVRRNIIFRGRVQGVFFRATTQQLARALGLSGWVRNLADGSVEMEVQGTPAQVEELLAALQQHYPANIRERLAQEIAVQDGAPVFTIAQSS